MSSSAPARAIAAREALINAKIGQQPAAPYYMAQTILMQEKALNEAQARIEELESGRVWSGPSRRPRMPGRWEQYAGLRAVAVSLPVQRRQRWASPAACSSATCSRIG